MSAHSYWEDVKTALNLEPRCETRDGVLQDMDFHEPTHVAVFDDMACMACSRPPDNIALAPCAWIMNWAQRLGVS